MGTKEGIYMSGLGREKEKEKGKGKGKRRRRKGVSRSTVRGATRLGWGGGCPLGFAAVPGCVRSICRRTRGEEGKEEREGGEAV